MIFRGRYIGRFVGLDTAIMVELLAYQRRYTHTHTHTISLLVYIYYRVLISYWGNYRMLILYYLKRDTAEQILELETIEFSKQFLQCQGSHSHQSQIHRACGLWLHTPAADFPSYRTARDHDCKAWRQLATKARTSKRKSLQEFKLLMLLKTAWIFTLLRRIVQSNYQKNLNMVAFL